MLSHLMSDMASDLRTDIKQRRPFDSPEQEAHLNIERTAAVLSHGFADALKEHGLQDNGV